MVVELIEQMHSRENTGYRELCERLGVGYSSFMRWRERERRGEAPVHRPGPAKTEPLDFDGLQTEIEAMHHRRKRTDGVGELYQEHKNAISRRDLNALVKAERDRQKQEKSRKQVRIHWHVPRLVWAMDDTEYRPDRNYPKAYLHNVQDLASRYKFGALVGLKLAAGDEVVAHLAELFSRHGPPLFLKRDNGGNLNHHEVDELLSTEMVIPLNSPPHYPQYNGSMERAQRDIKTIMADHAKTPNAFLAIQAEMDIHELNHRTLSDLNYRTPCDMFESGKNNARRYNRRKRKEVYEKIKENMLEIMTVKGYETNRAWRTAVRNWLLENGFITISRGGKV